MALEIVLITGMSGSGKSVALRALEDAGYYCVDNLPPELLTAFVALEHHHHGNRVAIAVDVRSAQSLHLLPEVFQSLKLNGIALRSFFLDATTETLVHRFSETRRRHPLSSGQTTGEPKALVQNIEIERELLAVLRERSHVIDSSVIRASQLQSYVKSLVQNSLEPLTIVFQSFAFKRGIPVDADYVFDVRMLPNPHYEPELKKLTGKDQPVQLFLQQQPDVLQMLNDIESFAQKWMDALIKNHRTYVTIAIGCTGGQHRSVYLVEVLTERFRQQSTTLARHRELDT